MRLAGRSRPGLRTCSPAIVICFVLALGRLGPPPQAAEPPSATPPAPLSIQQAVALAQEHRAEIPAARARALAAEQRPDMVSALEDPMLSPSLDHYPFEMMEEEDTGRRYDWSVSLEQRFPLSGVLGHRRRAADADAARLSAEADRTERDVELEAAAAFLMLFERRSMLNITREQLVLARQLVSAASARHASSQAGASDVLRAEVEVARLEALARSRTEEVQGSEAMLNASVGRPADTAVPPLEPPAHDRMPPPWAEVREVALRSRPELMAGAAEIRRAESEVEVMRSMYWPMGIVRLGPSSTMAEGSGAMLMVGVSLPIWRERLRAGVSEARAMQDMARADLEAMRRMVEGQAAASLSQVRAAREQLIGLRDDVVPRAQRTIAPALAEYSSGRGSLFATIEAAQALWMAQADLVMAETSLALAWARLQRATGKAGGETP